MFDAPMPPPLEARALCGGSASGFTLCLFSAETLTNVLDFKRDAGLWHAVLTVSAGHGAPGRAEALGRASEVQHAVTGARLPSGLAAARAQACLSPAERAEPHARDQHPVRADEGEPALLDPEGVCVQR